MSDDDTKNFMAELQSAIDEVVSAELDHARQEQRLQTSQIRLRNTMEKLRQALVLRDAGGET